EPQKRKKVKNSKKNSAESKIPSREQTFLLFKQGLKLQEIASQRKMSLGTVENHLIPYLTRGEININDLVDTRKQKVITEALEDFEYEVGLGIIKSKLPADISFAEIRYVLADRLKE
ncbi:MAG: helix-turn-helix domain-containing protein, partial [Bacteroidia bacterium]|nr:helix-turn-helix domain-containing protein [Bacteroidia bacterium]